MIDQEVELSAHDRSRAKPEAAQRSKSMPTEVAVNESATRYFNSQSKIVAQDCVERYAEDLCKEAGRLEAGARTAGGDPEITSSMVRDADLLLRRGYRQPRLRGWMITVRVCTPIAGFLTGILAELEKLQDPKWLISFIIFLSITVTLTTIIAAKE